MYCLSIRRTNIYTRETCCSIDFVRHQQRRSVKLRLRAIPPNSCVSLWHTLESMSGLFSGTIIHFQQSPDLFQVHFISIRRLKIKTKIYKSFKPKILSYSWVCSIFLLFISKSTSYIAHNTLHIIHIILRQCSIYKKITKECK